MAMSLQDGRYTTFLMLWALLSITGAGTLSLVWSRVVSGWFDAGRGTALGVTLMGTGITAMVAPPLTAYLIHLGGWRFAYRVLGAGAICISLPLLLLFLRDKTQGDPQTVPQPGVDVGRSLSHWRFWVIGFALFGETTVVSGLISNLFKLLTSQGYTSAHAATVAGLVGLFVIVGRASCGLLMDRFNPQAVGAAFFTGPPLACILLNVSHGSTVALLAAALIGLGAAAEFDVIPILLCRYFGIVRLGSILGLAMIFFSVGAALGPITFGHVFDVYGDYRLALWLGAALSASAATALLTLGRVSPDGTEPQSMESATPFDLGTLNRP
jgi:predicted MFS family arabinose efflux permease